MILATALADMETTNGLKVGEISFRQPVLLVFLRHFGCTFCREALGDLARHRSEIDQLGSQLILVHMSDKDKAEQYFDRYRLGGVEHVSDPDCKYYHAFGLKKGTARQLFGLHSWIRGFEAGVLEGHGVGTSAIGDGFQMPGIFVIVGGEVRNQYVHRLASDRPEYVSLLASCCTA